MTAEKSALQEKVESLALQIDEEKAKVRSMGRMNCEYVVEQEEVVAAKDAC